MPTESDDKLIERLTLLDSNFTGYVFCIHDSGGISPNIRAFNHPAGDLWTVMRKYPSAEVVDKRTGSDAKRLLAAESYGRMGELRRGGWSVL